MLFNSYPFLLLFLPAVLLGFFGLARPDRRAAAAWLAAASLFFYGWWNPAYAALLVASIAFNYLMGLAIARASNGRVRRVMTAAGGGANLAVLAYYKYAGFLLSQVSRLPGAAEATAGLVLPLGISFSPSPRSRSSSMSAAASPASTIRCTTPCSSPTSRI